MQENTGDKRLDRWLRVCVATGIVMRVAQWLSSQPIWHDEWMLLWNIENKPLADLLGKMEMNQGAPPVFLGISRSLYVLFGENRVALRTPSLVAGCAMLAIFALVARRLLGSTPGALVAVAALAFSDRVIWHSAEIKPYTIDALVAVTLIWAAVSLQGNPRWTALAILSAAGMWFSYTTLFILAGILTALGIQALPNRRDLIKWAATSATAATSLLAVYWLIARHQRTPGLADAWTEDYVPWSTPWLAPLWCARKTLELCSNPAHNVGPVVLALVALGGWTLWKSRGTNRLTLAILLGPVLLVFLASTVKVYPYGGSRATLFLVPGLFLLMGTGVETLRTSVSIPRIRQWWWLPGGAVAVVLLLPALYHLAAPRVRTPEIPKLVAYVEDHHQDGDGIYVASHDGWPAEFVSYWSDRGRTVWPREDNATPPAQSTRLWVVGTYKSKSEFDLWLREVNPAARGLSERTRLELRHGTAVLFE